MRQVALGQTEYYADNGIYYPGKSGVCTPTADKSEEVEKYLLGGAKVIIDSNQIPKKAISGYYICVSDHATNFQVIALDADNSQGCTITLTADSSLKRDKKTC